MILSSQNELQGLNGLKFLNGLHMHVAPTRRAPLRGERSCRRGAPSEIFSYTIIIIQCSINIQLINTSCHRPECCMVVYFSWMIYCFGLIENFAGRILFLRPIELHPCPLFLFFGILCWINFGQRFDENKKVSLLCMKCTDFWWNFFYPGVMITSQIFTPGRLINAIWGSFTCNGELIWGKYLTSYLHPGVEKFQQEPKHFTTSKLTFLFASNLCPKFIQHKNAEKEEKRSWMEFSRPKEKNTAWKIFYQP